MIPLYLLIALQVLDAATTMMFLSRGVGVEANPIMRKLFERFGPAPVLIVVKGAVIAMLWWATTIRCPQEAVIGAWVLVAIYVWIVVNNIKLLRK
jgi:hypothetical protein